LLLLVVSHDEPKEFSRAVENLIAGFREVPEDSSRSKRRKTTDLTALIDELLVKYRISHDSLEHSIRDKWPELVGVANASYSHPVVVEKGLLVVLVSHAVVRNELFLHRQSILEKLKQVPGCAGIKGLALRTG
jgi:Dna[CI] antecedent, DciA